MVEAECIWFLFHGNVVAILQRDYFWINQFKEEAYMFTYQGKTALISGASSGIGRAFAHTLAWRGISVILPTSLSLVWRDTVSIVSHLIYSFSHALAYTKKPYKYGSY